MEENQQTGPQPEIKKDTTAEPHAAGASAGAEATDPFGRGSSWNCASTSAAVEAAREALQQAEEAAMSLVAPDVTRHLVNAQQELLRAGMRLAQLANQSAESLGEKAISALEAKAVRAAEIHQQRQAGKPN
jgi:hypothetical protein